MQVTPFPRAATTTPGKMPIPQFRRPGTVAFRRSVVARHRLASGAAVLFARRTGAFMRAYHAKKPPPLLEAAAPVNLCPHCGKRSYSAAGVHPQCSQAQASKLSAPVKKK
jgi:hypothetical protein